MAEKDDENLIGFDPLAWMHERADEAPTTTAQPEDRMETVAVDDLTDTFATSEPMQESSYEAATNDTARIVLESTQGIQNVIELHESLLTALNQADNIEIDASAVQQIDTASLQLLLVLKRSAVSLQKQVTIDFPSERFIEAATLLGLAEMLEVDHSAAGFF